MIYAKDMGLLYMEVSAKNNENINEVFLDAVKHVPQEVVTAVSASSTVSLTPTPVPAILNNSWLVNGNAGLEIWMCLLIFVHVFTLILSILTLYSIIII